MDIISAWPGKGLKAGVSSQANRNTQVFEFQTFVEQECRSWSWNQNRASPRVKDETTSQEYGGHALLVVWEKKSPNSVCSLSSRGRICAQLMTCLFKGAGHDSQSLGEWFQKSVQHKVPCLASVGSAVTGWSYWKLPAGLQRHARQLCCANTVETIKMHLQNEVLCFISIVSRAWSYSYLRAENTVWGLPFLDYCLFVKHHPVQSHSDTSFQVKLSKVEKTKPKPRTKASGLVFSFLLSTGDCLTLLPVAKRATATHPISVFISYSMPIVQGVLFWDT